jgi:hypothetical protein
MRRRPSDQACGAGFGFGCHCQSCCSASVSRHRTPLKSDKPCSLSMLDDDDSMPPGDAFALQT